MSDSINKWNESWGPPRRTGGPDVRMQTREAWEERSRALEAELSSAATEIERLRKAIREAPCPLDRLQNRTCARCNCWKHEALGDGD